MKTIQYTLIKLPIQEILAQNGTVTLDMETAIRKSYLVKQDNSLLFDQIERLRGHSCEHIEEMILVTAHKNPRQEDSLRTLLRNGFTYNGIHYSRFGKSASQGKEGITAFVCDSLHKTLYDISQMDLPVQECVISKYEAQRCLIFSSCTVIPDYVPNIVIIGEYQKTLPHQLVQYAVEHERTYTDSETGEERTYLAKEIETGYRDIPLSPFDGCGCHEASFREQITKALGLDYSPVGCQIRMPFLKGYSVYVPFREILREWGCEQITDIYGKVHPIDTIDCIWNISMFKGHSLFQSAYGTDAWTEYKKTFHKYHFKLGISKYSHHVKNINRKTRMNFQYLQCLDLWNPKYIERFEKKQLDSYDILSPDNEGKILSIARYTTDLYEKIIKKNPFYLYKFLGITDSERYEPASQYLEALMINDAMQDDPAIKNYIYRKLKKAINEAKFGKIYAEGFYHTVTGDMIGYLEYAAGKEPVGCLKAHEFYCKNLPQGDCLSFRSPLVCPSEVNKVKLVSNAITEKWLSCFQEQDIVMLNMYDLSAPQQGGMDYDGDIVFLCTEPAIVSSKIEKPIVIDMDDKALTSPKPYTTENLIEYEIMTRDSRIGEITNAATCIENRYTDSAELKALYDKDISLLRLYQGKEIDFLKTGLRWNMGKHMRKYLTQLPYFLLFHYPQKKKTYESLVLKNKNKTDPENQYILNAYHSPSPMNELCDYICTWERRHILWDSDNSSLPSIRQLILNPDWELTDRPTMRLIRHTINDYAVQLRQHLELLQSIPSNDKEHFDSKTFAQPYRDKLINELQLPEEIIANYVIQVSYSNPSLSKALVWAAYGEYIIGNLKRNTNTARHISIQEVPKGTEGSCEYLGKYYEYKEADCHR